MPSCRMAVTLAVVGTRHNRRSPTAESLLTTTATINTPELLN